MKEKRAIKFYLDESVNQVKKDKIIKFLKECQDVENKLLEYYWNNYNLLIDNRKWLNFYSNRIMITEPFTRFQHYMQILHMTYMELMSIHSKIINKIYFRFNNKEKQRIYNYCKGFCFDWDYLFKYIKKKLKESKCKDDNVYYNFLKTVNEYIKNEHNYNIMKQDIESNFWEIKNKFKQPKKKEFQIHCNTHHTVDIELKEFQWIFIIDSNTILHGKRNRAVYDKLIIPVKYSKYHKNKLEGKQLANTFTLRLNRYGRIEIIGCYDIEVNNPIPNPINIVGIDIGLKKLITCSDGEIIEQNNKILKTTKRLVKHQSNRERLESHLQKKYNDENFKLGDKRYLLFQTRLANFVKTDNRYRIKQFLQGREQDHIIMENLEIGYSKTYSKEINYLLKRMGIQNIKTNMIKYCKEFGIKTSLINPAYTSQQCPVCGYISKDNRKTQEKFCCVKCNHTANADMNASINIMNRYFDNRITLSTPSWRVKEILLNG